MGHVCCHKRACPARVSAEVDRSTKVISKPTTPTEPHRWLHGGPTEKPRTGDGAEVTKCNGCLPASSWRGRCAGQCPSPARWCDFQGCLCDAAPSETEFGAPYRGPPIKQSLKRCTLSCPMWLFPSVPSGSSLPTNARHSFSNDDLCAAYEGAANAMRENTSRMVLISGSPRGFCARHERD